MSAYRPAVSEQQETDFMENLLGNMDNMTDVPPPPKPRKRKTEHEPQSTLR